MIEIVTNNVKQIGTLKKESRVYTSERAYKRIKEGKALGIRVFILMGHTESSGGKYATFLEEAIPVGDVTFDRGAPVLSNKVWSGVYSEIKRCCEDLVIMGWALDMDGMEAAPTSAIESVHRQNFGGIHQLLFLYNDRDKEEYFYSYRDGHLVRKSAFFIYYNMKEKDKEVEIEIPKEPSVEVDIPSEYIPSRSRYRQVLEEREKERSRGGIFSAVFVVAVAVLVVLIGLELKPDLKDIFNQKEVPAFAEEETEGTVSVREIEWNPKE